MSATDESLQVQMDAGVRRRLAAVAAQEGRSVGAVVQDAVDLYLRSRSSGHRRYWELAGRYLDAAPESDEKALLAAQLTAAIARGRGVDVPARGGSPTLVRARLKQRQLEPSSGA